MDRMQDQHEKIMKSHEREISQLQDKLFKIDAQLQQAVKDKNSAQTQSLSKDKELSDLQKSQAFLKSKVNFVFTLA